MKIYNVKFQIFEANIPAKESKWDHVYYETIPLAAESKNDAENSAQKMCNDFRDQAFVHSVEEVSL